MASPIAPGMTRERFEKQFFNSLLGFLPVRRRCGRRGGRRHHPPPICVRSPRSAELPRPKAAVAFAGAAMIEATKALTQPIVFVLAVNDHSIAPFISIL
ncbi:hypothetical protein CHELA40_10664 [Chelatococcus asaccharovorans]|nr:hypothetical protein CHELA40_10664 [Chelatococcus asaccharovorans]CAH1686313.1 hypothetical protein CHELA17_64944 [Chelatococcus asaccharovorans]